MNRIIKVILGCSMIFGGFYCGNAGTSDEPTCYRQGPVECPERQCGDTACILPSEEAINASTYYTHSMIGLPLSGLPAGKLPLRSQDVGCPMDARWHELHSVEEVRCIEDGFGDFGEKSVIDETLPCAVERMCQDSCVTIAGLYVKDEYNEIKVFHMTRDGVGAVPNCARCALCFH